MIGHIIGKTCIFLIQVYRYCISPFKKPACRFEPSCSLYAIHAIEYHGVVKGLVLTFKRLFRCHPYSKQHGFDPVIQSHNENSTKVFPSTKHQKRMKHQ